MEPINMLECRLNLFPAKFYRQGNIYNVEAVVECQTDIVPSGRSDVYHFWVRCEGKLLHLRQGLVSGQWALQHD